MRTTEIGIISHQSAISRIVGQAIRLRRVQLGGAMVLVVLAVAVFGPYLASDSPVDFVAQPFAPPGNGLMFGADYLGRDVLTRFLYGGVSLLAITIPATIIGVGLGSVIGLSVSLMKSTTGEAVMRLLDLLLAFPQVVLALLFITMIGPQPWLLILVVALAHLPQSARVIRGASSDIVERDFIRAAEIIGTPWHSILFKEVVPNVCGPLLVEFGLRFNYSIAIVAALSFLGFGKQPPAADWGLMVSENKVALIFQPWGTLLPIIAIAVLTVGTNLVADGIAHVSARITTK